MIEQLIRAKLGNKEHLSVTCQLPKCLDYVLGFKLNDAMFPVAHTSKSKKIRISKLKF